MWLIEQWNEQMKKKAKKIDYWNVLTFQISNTNNWLISILWARHFLVENYMDTYTHTRVRISHFIVFRFLCIHYIGLNIICYLSKAIKIHCKEMQSSQMDHFFWAHSIKENNFFIDMHSILLILLVFNFFIANEYVFFFRRNQLRFVYCCIAC